MTEDLELFEANTHVFMIKIWLEEINVKDRQAKWRGYITHIPSGERQYVESLSAIISFIIHYLKEMGAQPSKIWQFLSAFKRFQKNQIMTVGWKDNNEKDHQAKK